MSNNKKPIYNEEQVEKLASHIKAIIELLGEDPEREGLLKTPQRAAKALIDNTSGYQSNADQLIKQALFAHEGDEMVIVKPRWSAFFGTGLDGILKDHGIKNVILAGTTTPNCIRTTCYDAIAYDYRTLILEKCTSSRTADIQKANIEDMRRAGAEIIV